VGKARRSDPKPADPAGGRGTWGPSPGFLAAALGLVVGGVAMAWIASPLSSSDSTPATAPPAAASTAMVPTPLAISGSASGPLLALPAPPAAAASGVAQRIPRTRDPNGDQTPDLADYVNEGERPTMAQVIERLHLAGVTSGLGAFSPPGTRPPLVGLAVPEDFAVPEGYVRHYQATDDGQRIEPILMFAPDHQFFDAARRPIAIPPDRVVPPELAPPGLPIRRIVIPASVDGPRS